jgi:hypothetical protein
MMLTTGACGEIVDPLLAAVVWICSDTNFSIEIVEMHSIDPYL